jgi:hypothetical protein
MFLADFGDAPFNIIRFWMHGLSVLARNKPRPNLVWWRGDVILMLGHEVSFTQYREKTYEKVLQLESLILNEIFFGFYTMEEAEELFDLKTLEESGDEVSLGHGVIADTTNSLMRTAQSDKFFQRLFKEKKLEIRSNARGGIAVDPVQGLLWIAAIHKAFGMLVAACHVLVIAGRGTEWETISPTNNEDGRKGVVYDPGANTGAFDAEYHKGLNVQGVNKHLRRYMPYEIFRLLYLLLRVVRSIELMVLFATIIPDTDKPATLEAYNKHIFASFGKAWVSPDISRALQDWFKDIISIPLGIHDYRHMAIAIQRKYMNVKEKQPSRMEITLNKLRGHKKVVGDSHYAREVYLGTCSEDRDLALEVAREYHRVMGFSTGSDDELMPEAKKLRENFSYKPPVISAPMKKLANKGKQKSAAPPPLPPATPKKGKSIATHSLSQDAGPVVIRRSTRARITSKRYNDKTDKSIFED